MRLRGLRGVAVGPGTVLMERGVSDCIRLYQTVSDCIRMYRSVPGGPEHYSRLPRYVAKVLFMYDK